MEVLGTKPEENELATKNKFDYYHAYITEKTHFLLKNCTNFKNLRLFYLKYNRQRSQLSSGKSVRMMNHIRGRHKRK